MLLSSDMAQIARAAGGEEPVDARRMSQTGSMAAQQPVFLSTLPAAAGERRLALAVVAISTVIFLAAVPFAKLPLAPLAAFIPIYQSALVVNDLITAVLLFGQFSILRSRGLLLLASGYLFTAFMAASHALSFPGLFAPGGLLGAGPQTTAWLYMFWHGGFPLLVIAYALDRKPLNGPRGGAVVSSIAAALVAVVLLTALATAGQDFLPAIMRGNHYTPALITVISSVWALSLVALVALWWRRPHSVLDLWLMVVLCAWLFDIGLSAVFNAGRFDLGFYAGRIYGLLAASLVLMVLLLDNGMLYSRLAETHAEHQERLRILHEIDRAVVAGQPPEAIAAAVIQPLRALLGVPRAIVNKFDLAAGEVEWMAAAGRRRTRVGPGVRYSIRLMGNVEALRRGEHQLIDVRTLPPGPEVDALLASGVRIYMAVPMIAGGELLGALSFGSDANVFTPEKVNIAREVATQLAIAVSQARLLAQVRAHAAQLESRVSERTAQLQAANRELEDLYNNAPCGYHSVGKDGVFVRMNDTELKWLGYERAEVIGKMGPRDLHTASSLEVFLERFERFKETGVSRNAEYEFRRKDGSVLPVVLSATAIRDQAGNFLMSRSTIFDNTERKRAEEAVHALNKELESFTYSVSHDLRAPLRAVDGFAKMLEEDHGQRLDDEGRRLLGVVRESSQRMGQLIDDLLAFSRLGRQVPARRPIDMAALAREVADELAGGTRAEVALAQLPPTDADRALIRQVWVNLIGNAIKYSAKRDAPRIEIGGREEPSESIYWVRDNGAGFDMRYAAKLFNVFQRLHGQDEFPGTGVGLAIVQRVVTRHGGRVWAEGRPDEGARFFFSMPKKA
jgi:PAS domain S-box-containing protein